MIDPNIYSQLQPNLAMGLGDLVNKYTANQQAEEERQNRLVQLARQGEMQQMQLEQAKQNQADIKATRQAMAAAGGDISKAVPELQKAGAYEQAAALLKQQKDAQVANMEFAQKRHESMASLANDISQNPAQWQLLVQNAAKTGAVTPEDAQLIMQTYSSMPQDQIGPHALRGSIMAKDASAKIAEQLYPKPQQPSWHLIETDRGQILVNANQPNAPKQFAPKPKQDNTLVAVIGPDGQTPVLVPRSQASGMTPAGSKGAASPNQHISDAKESNALLDQVEKVGPIATGSAAGNVRDILAGAIGQSTEGAKAAAQMKVLGASLTAKVPKMSGPQSDKDVAMYKEAAGNIGNPNVPWEIKKAAIATIREINNRQLSYGNDISKSNNQQSPAGSNPDIEAILNKHGVK